jgi:hypothetical protein
MGPQGPAGPAGLAWRGPWSALVQYQANDVVSYNGSSWVALAGNLNTAPSTSTGYWSVLAQAGTPGLPGMNWRGPWSSTTSYSVNDVVSYSGSSWVAKYASTNAVPSTSSAQWTMLAQAGTNGTNGVSGLEYNGATTVVVPTGGTTASVGCATPTKKILSGGYTGTSNSIYAVQSYPSSATNTWSFRFVNSGSAGTVTLYAVCATAG